jgi:endonuclease YncB( thermonuclease family)
LQADVTVNSPPVHQTPHKIRPSGIDAPEKAQPYGLQSRQSLSDMALGRTENQLGEGNFTLDHQH